MDHVIHSGDSSSRSRDGRGEGKTTTALRQISSIDRAGTAHSLLESSPEGRWATTFTGGATLALGLITLTGWAFRISGAIEWRSGWGGMVLMTAVCAVLGGTGLLASLLKDGELTAQTRLVIGVAISLISALTIAEILSDRNLGIDFAALHASMLPDYPPPGRMAPNTALGFLLFGLALGIWGHDRRVGVVRTLTVAVFCIGGLGFAGYCLGMKFLYGWYTSSRLVRMSLPTSVSLLLLSVGLWWSSRENRGGSSVADAEAQVLRTIFGDTTALMLITAVAVAVTGVAFLQTTMFRYTSDHLFQLERDDHDLIELTIDHCSDRAAVAGGGSWLSRHMRIWDSSFGPKFESAHAKEVSAEAMRSFASGLLGQGFSGVVYRAPSGRSLEIGTMVDASAMRTPIRLRPGEELIWSNGFYLETDVKMRDKDGVAGEMLAQQPMPMLDRLEASTNASSKTGALVLCGRTDVPNIVRCFPMRTQPLPFSVDLATRSSPAGGQLKRSGPSSPSRGSEPLPMTLALTGQTGVVLTRDYWGRPVTAAYSPLESATLGLVLKMETAETYAPIRRSLTTALPLGILIALISLRLMQRRLTPLVDGLVNSRERIRKLSLHDPLTGLPNRSLMDDRLRMALEWARRNRHSVAVAVLDLDDFKRVNDTFGHEAGDQLLQVVARRLEGCMRASDTVARLGGDEFVLICNEIQSIDSVSVLGEKILAAFSTPMELAGRLYKIQLSIGFAISPPGGGEEVTLIRNADTAMYSAKKSGGFRFVVFEEAPSLPPLAEQSAASSGAAVSGVRQANLA